MTFPTVPVRAYIMYTVIKHHLPYTLPLPSSSLSITLATVHPSTAAAPLFLRSALLSPSLHSFSWPSSFSISPSNSAVSRVCSRSAPVAAATAFSRASRARSEAPSHWCSARASAATSPSISSQPTAAVCLPALSALSRTRRSRSRPSHAPRSSSSWRREGGRWREGG